MTANRSGFSFGGNEKLLEFVCGNEYTSMDVLKFARAV